MTSHERQSVANRQQICSLFKFVEANTTSIKENIKTPLYWPFVCVCVCVCVGGGGGGGGGRWIPLNEGY